VYVFIGDNIHSIRLFCEKAAVLNVPVITYLTRPLISFTIIEEADIDSAVDAVLDGSFSSFPFTVSTITNNNVRSPNPLVRCFVQESIQPTFRKKLEIAASKLTIGQMNDKNSKVLFYPSSTTPTTDIRDSIVTEFKSQDVEVYVSHPHSPYSPIIVYDLSVASPSFTSESNKPSSFHSYSTYPILFAFSFRTIAELIPLANNSSAISPFYSYSSLSTFPSFYPVSGSSSSSILFTSSVYSVWTENISIAFDVAKKLGGSLVAINGTISSSSSVFEPSFDNIVFSKIGKVFFFLFCIFCYCICCLFFYLFFKIYL
jgi:acyl-CoA reductase-like NAD-dependent aldehyde dehydrogenase